LTWLDCNFNPLSSLNVSKNIALNYLHCSRNNLKSLDVSKNTSLTQLICSTNELKSLDVSRNISLELLNCHTNSIKYIDLSKNNALSIFICEFNDLQNLDISRTSVGKLNCKNNPDLNCIQVKNAIIAYNNYNFQKDKHAVYSEDCSLVSVEEETNPYSDITISPNPASDYFEISIPPLEMGSGSVSVFDVFGIEVLNTSTSFLRKQESHGNFNEIPNQVGNDSQVIRIDISSIPPGVYFVRVGGKVMKFIKI